MIVLSVLSNCPEVYYRVPSGILLLTGYHSNTLERDYWSDDEDHGIALGKDVRSRNFFQKFKSYIQFMDNGTVRFRAKGAIRRKSDKPRVSFRRIQLHTKERDTFGFAFDENSEIFLVRWNNKSTANVSSNFSTLEPFFDVKRFGHFLLKQEKRRRCQRKDYKGKAKYALANVTKRFVRLALDRSTKIRVKFN
ncbi:hypothetical protein TNCV_2726061 [Trichonephila clavipes]|nr:hypothetical protein TNCV_2726061 [Trichonephila clavipes]